MTRYATGRTAGSGAKMRSTLAPMAQPPTRPPVGPLVFATANPHKVEEVRAKLGPDSGLELLGLRDIGCDEPLPETTGTIPGNALEKARYVRERYGRDCFAEDSGLEVDALRGRPGVDTADYSGTRDDDANMDKVLGELSAYRLPGQRTARFRAVIALCLGGEEHVFEGAIEGRIAFAKTGDGGFGYDPIFIPVGHQHTFAELPAEVKRRISHRARAVEALVELLTGRG